MCRPSRARSEQNEIDRKNLDWLDGFTPPVICVECLAEHHEYCAVDLNDDDPEGEGPVPCECSCEFAILTPSHKPQ